MRRAQQPAPRPSIVDPEPASLRAPARPSLLSAAPAGTRQLSGSTHPRVDQLDDFVGYVVTVARAMRVMKSRGDFVGRTLGRDRQLETLAPITRIVFARADDRSAIAPRSARSRAPQLRDPRTTGRAPRPLRLRHQKEPSGDVRVQRRPQQTLCCKTSGMHGNDDPRDFEFLRRPRRRAAVRHRRKQERELARVQAALDGDDAQTLAIALSTSATMPAAHASSQPSSCANAAIASRERDASIGNVPPSNASGGNRPSTMLASVTVARSDARSRPALGRRRPTAGRRAASRRRPGTRWCRRPR